MSNDAGTPKRSKWDADGDGGGRSAVQLVHVGERVGGRGAAQRGQVLARAAVVLVRA